jgi:hypothetical protein
LKVARANINLERPRNVAQLFRLSNEDSHIKPCSQKAGNKTATDVAGGSGDECES